MKFDGENPILDSLFSDKSFRIKDTFGNDATSTESKVQELTLKTTVEVQVIQSTQRVPFLIELVFTGGNVIEEEDFGVVENDTASLSNLSNLTKEKSFINLPNFVTEILETTGLPVSG